MSIQMNDNNQSQKISLKFLTLGDSKIGKTSILERYVNKTFKDNYLVTIGMDIRIKRLTINNNNIDIHVTDTAGQERFRSISKMSYKRSDGILVGFALNDEKTFESISYWIEQIYENKGKNSDVSVVLFGNKCDDKEHIVVKEEEINKIKNQYNLQYFETSAKENINVKELFEHLIKITIVNKGLLKNFGLKENASIDEIIITERENQHYKAEKIPKKQKKKKFC
jgi:small GTP-binding protein